MHIADRSVQVERSEALGPASQLNAARYLSVAQAAAMLDVSPMTLYRAIAAGQFPAIKIRGRLKILAVVVDEILAAARAGQMVDVAEWTAGRRANGAARVEP